MTHRNRKGRLERGGQLYNERQAARIVPLLTSMQLAATHAQELAAGRLAAVLQLLDDLHGITEAQVRARWVSG